MTDDELLTMLESNLELILDYMDSEAREAKEAELTVYLNAAKKYIETEGITLDLTDTGDCLLVVMYAGWLYERRKSQDTLAMPRMLRWNLNNRLFSEKINET